MNAVVALRNLARQNMLMVQLSTILRGVNPKKHTVQRGLTRICIEGYPRSANSFAVRMFRTANNDVHVGHHTHSTANIARALRYGIPTVVLIRNPVDAITSAVIANNRGDIDGEACYYLDFYRWVERRVDSVVVADFETVITDFNFVIRLVNEKHDATFNYIEDLDVTAERVKQDFHSRFAHQGQRRRRLQGMRILRNALPDALLLPEDRKDGRRRWIGIPNVEREKMKREIRPWVACHERIGEAQALYARLIEQRSYE